MELSKKAKQEFYREESKEKCHKPIKKALEKAGGEKGYSKEHHEKMHKHHSKLADHHKAMAKKAEHSSKKPNLKGDSEKNPKVKKFIEKRMHDFKENNMHSRVKKTGPVVTNPKQAIAISLSEAREKGARIPKKKK